MSPKLQAELVRRKRKLARALADESEVMDARLLEPHFEASTPAGRRILSQLAEEGELPAAQLHASALARLTRDALVLVKDDTAQLAPGVALLVRLHAEETR